MLERMLACACPEQVPGLARFFKTGPGQYGEGDKFLGIKVPVTRAVVKECWKEMLPEGWWHRVTQGSKGASSKSTGVDEVSQGTTEIQGADGDLTFPQLEECIASEYHEVRLAALLALVEIYRHNKELREGCIDFYLSHTSRINNWDLVDLSCYPLLGEWLIDKDRALLYRLARSGKTIWEQRIGIVSTMTFVRHGQLHDTFDIADILLHHPHDLIQKAVGWLLREAGKRDKVALEAFLAPRYRSMPRTMLRYAIERFPENERRGYLLSRKVFRTFVKVIQ